MPENYPKYPRHMGIMRYIKPSKSGYERIGWKCSRVFRHLRFSLVAGGSSPPWPWNAILNSSRLQNLRPLALSSLLFSRSSKLPTCVSCPPASLSLTFQDLCNTLFTFPQCLFRIPIQSSIYFFLFLNFIIGVKLIYNVLVISAVQHSEWTISFTYIPSLLCLSPIPPSSPSRSSQSIKLSSLYLQQVPTSYPFYTW